MFQKAGHGIQPVSSFHGLRLPMPPRVRASALGQLAGASAGKRACARAEVQAHLQRERLCLHTHALRRASKEAPVRLPTCPRSQSSTSWAVVKRRRRVFSGLWSTRRRSLAEVAVGLAEVVCLCVAVVCVRCAECGVVVCEGEPALGTSYVD